MKDRILSTVGLWTLVGLVLWFSSRYDAMQVAGFAVILLLGLAAQYETYRLLERCGAKPDITTGLIAGGGLMVAQFLGFVTVSAGVAVLALGWVAALLSLLRNSGETKAWMLRTPTLFGLLYVPFLLCFLSAFVGWGRPGSPDGLWLGVWVIAVTKFTDVGGLLIGVPFGRHKIAPEVSPAKSWEGTLGGVALACAVGALGAWALSSWTRVEFHPLRGALYALPLAALSLPSDLVESHLKRRAGVKDSGSTIPGIGGALDLIDSLLLVAPVAYLLLIGRVVTKVG